MDSLGSLLYLQEQLAEGNTADPKKLRAAMKASITLLGNATAHFNLKRQKSAMKHLNRSPTTGKGRLPNRGPWLFGEDFSRKAKSMSDSIRALKTTLGKRKMPFSSGGGPQEDKSTQARTPRAAVFTGFLCNSSQPDPSSRGWDHSHVPNLRRHRHPAQTATSRASQGPQKTTQLGSADISRHNRTLSVRQ